MRDARAARLAGRHRRRPPARRSCCPTTTWTRWRGRSPPTARHRGDHHRGGAGQHGRGAAGAGLQRRPRRDRPRPRRAADPRRGDDRLPGRPRRLGRPRRPRRRAGRRRPLHLRQGDGRRPARGRVRRPDRDHGAARPGRAGLPGRHALGEPAGLRGRARHAARSAPDDVYARLDKTAAVIGDLASQALARGRRAAPACSTPATCSRSSSPTPRCATTTAAQTPGRRRRSGRSSTRCWRAGSTCRRRRSRRGSSRPRSTTRRWRSSPPPCRHRPRAAAARARGVSTETVVHLLRHGEVENPSKILYGRLPGFRLSSLGEQMAKAAAQALAARDITHVVASPLERARQTAEPIAAQFGLPDRGRRAPHRERELLRGQAGRRRRRRAARPAQLVGAARPVQPVVGRELRLDRPAHVRRAAGRPRRGRGARGGLRLAPAAHLDAAPVPRAQAPLARPAPPPVRPGQPDQFPLRRARPWSASDTASRRPPRSPGSPGARPPRAPDVARA